MVELNSERQKKAYLNLIAIRNSLSYVQNETYRRINDGLLKTIGFPYVGKLAKNRKQFIGDKMDLMI